MSILNNRLTLQPYLGRVWLTRPRPFALGEVARQDINVCVEQPGGEFTALGRLQLAKNGTYYHRGKALGKWEDEGLRQYVEKLAGVAGQSEAALFEQVCATYAKLGDAAETATALGLSKERVRRILITSGALHSALIEQIAWLYDEGRGKSVAQIAEMLKVSESTVQKNMAYEKKP